MEKTRIFHVISGKANPDSMNGVNKVVHTLASEQVKMGYDVIVIAIANNDIKRHTPIYTYKLFKKNRIPFVPNSDALKYILANSDENSIFHFHSVFVPWFLWMIKSLKSSNRNHIVLTPHGGYQLGTMKSLKKRFFFKFWDSRVIRMVEAVQIMGYVTERCSYIENNAKKIVEIPNGFADDIPVLNKSVTNIIGMLCRLDMHHKGLDILIPAFARYKNEGGVCNLRIAGTGPHEHILRQMVDDLKIRDFVEFVGPLYGNDKWNFLNDLVAHIAPSRYEGMPTACLESAYMGCVQLVSEQTNLGKYVTKYNAGLVLSELTQENIFVQLQQFDLILQSPSVLVKMRDGAKQMVYNDLNWNNIANMINNLLYGIKD